jgi:hypothetical protein
MLAYNITVTVQRQNATNFFGQELGPINHLDPNLLSADPSHGDVQGDVPLSRLPTPGIACKCRTRSRHARSILEVTGFDELGSPLTCVATGHILHNPRLSVVVLHLPDVGCLLVWRSPIIATLLYDTTMHSID